MTGPKAAAIRAVVGTRDLIGAWELGGWEIRYPDGTLTRPFGVDADGLLLYSPDGWMSASISAAGREQVRGGSLRTASSEQQAAALCSYFSYAGTFFLDDGVVVHRVQFALDPALVGTTQRRVIDIDVDAGRMTLSADEAWRAGVRTHALRWHRATRP